MLCAALSRENELFKLRVRVVAPQAAVSPGAERKAAGIPAVPARKSKDDTEQ